MTDPFRYDLSLASAGVFQVPKKETPHVPRPHLMAGGRTHRNNHPPAPRWCPELVRSLARGRSRSSERESISWSNLSLLALGSLSWCRRLSRRSCDKRPVISHGDRRASRATHVALFGA